MRQPDEALAAKIQKIKEALIELGDLRPGTLSQQYNVCGNPTCRCKADPPRRHGPYYQLSFTWQGRSKTQFVRREDVREVRAQLRNYQKLRKLVDEWVGLAMDLSRLKLQKSHHPRPPSDGKRQPQANSPAVARGHNSPF